MSKTETVTIEGLPWMKPRGRRQREALHLVLCWSLDEPHRVGEVAPLEGGRVLGRGEATAEDGAPRLQWYRSRLGHLEPRPPLASKRISRVQLRLQVGSEGVEVTNVGRCEMATKGTTVTRAELGAGDLLLLRNTALFLVTERELGASGGTAVGIPGAMNLELGEPDASGLVGESPVVWELRAQIALAASGPHHVLIQGESGSGKELVARALHLASGRSAGPFIARNAATFPEGLVDAELFGSAKNYPHAGSPERPGLVGEADGGTLFLDEIGELPHAMQAHLLRLLDRDGEYQRLGEARTRRVDLRVVAATNRPVDALKHDLAARFAVRIAVPTLNERREDIPLLIRHLLRRASESTPTMRERFFERIEGKLEPRIDPGLVEALITHDYTTHLRELDRLLWEAVAASRGQYLELTDPLRQRLAPPTAPPPGELDAAAVRDALAQAQGNVTAAARQLGLKNRFALYRLMKRLGLETPSDGSG